MTCQFDQEDNLEDFLPLIVIVVRRGTTTEGIISLEELLALEKVFLFPLR